ncbi:MULTISPECIES: hypothetical protein [Hydrocarboniphaga]|jgi:hypothetical protein|uniref:DUF1471 domain-containing protein n=1 Tax=Hydrocarboniphaga effusa AP103 TaxID=1172194 RepID=I8I631_9GAMM|nr:MULTISPECIES: hypothetical protein [Hydrocarboniphaga]EIT72111.1 hypothetical protein WQQ_22480 [Hydrocarboniphaga effusa AP103]MDZ4078990.1 hypothetical protein [Hydrocarboniphaga sp.]
MKTPSKLILVAALLASGDALAADSVLVVTAEQKSQCRFMHFIDVRGSSAEDALQAAYAKVKHYKGDALYVRNQSENEKGVLISGEGLKCRP